MNNRISIPKSRQVMQMHWVIVAWPCLTIVCRQSGMHYPHSNRGPAMMRNGLTYNCNTCWSSKPPCLMTARPLSGLGKKPLQICTVIRISLNVAWKSATMKPLKHGWKNAGNPVNGITTTGQSAYKSTYPEQKSYGPRRLNSNGRYTPKALI